MSAVVLERLAVRVGGWPASLRCLGLLPRPRLRAAAGFSTATPPSAELTAELTAPNGQAWSQPLGLFINNAFVRSSTGETIASINPTTEEEICAVQAASEADVDAAVQAARQAFAGAAWRRLAGPARGALLHRLADLVEAEAPRLAAIEALDNGKPYAAALAASVPEAVAVLRYYAGFADKTNGGRVVDVGAGRLAYTVRAPLGVCGQIVPFNYPLELAVWKLAPALCGGNTVVLKPAEQTPLSLLYVAGLVAAAGFPPGVVNVVPGRGPVAGAALARHPRVAKIAFTGSTATGRAVMRTAAGTLKAVTLETGGKSPLVVFADADLDRAAAWAHTGCMSNQGQVCTATSRILVQAAVHDAFVARFARFVAASSVVGDPFAPATFQGPQVSREQRTRVLDFLQAGRDAGATVVVGEGTIPIPSKGFFVAPTVFTGVTPAMAIYREEIFGPCAVVTPFETEADAVALANDSEYGLGAAVFTRDVARAHRVAHAIEAGMVWINSSNDSDYRMPFGGVKQSGVGRELGEAGLDAYSSIKSVYVDMEEEASC